MSLRHYVAAVQWNFNRYACRLGSIQLNMPSWPLEIKEKSYLTDALHQPCQLTVWNFISQDCYIVNTTYMQCRDLLIAAAATYMPAGLVLLSTTPLLFKHAYWLRTAARWMLAGLWPLNQHACWPLVTQYCMSAGIVLLYLLFLLIWCLSTSPACWYGISLSAVPAGVVLHYS